MGLVSFRLAGNKGLNYFDATHPEQRHRIGDLLRKGKQCLVKEKYKRKNKDGISLPKDSFGIFSFEYELL